VNQTVEYLALRAPQVGRRIRQRAAGERGQATVEYVALVTLVALVMFGVITAMKTYKFAEGQQLALLLIKKIEEAVKQVHY
jgi:Flp pilus assembly pilin Flp